LCALKVLSALDHVHTRGWVHRELNPEAIVVCTDESGVKSWKLKDFEMATPREGRGMCLGNDSYAAPETRGRSRGACKYEPASDIFSLGVVFHELFTGVDPVYPI
jgi:serine/threonine-protein kinase PpkA